MKPSEGFIDRIKEVWGNPKKVAEVLHNELWDIEVAGGDCDDQVSDGQHMGVVAGRSADHAPERCVELFQEWLDENHPPDEG